MLQALLASAAAALIAGALCIGIPLALVLRADYRRARALGVTDPATVIRNRFFIPRRPSSALGTLGGRQVWVDCWTLGCVVQSVGRVVAVDDGGALRIESEGGAITFRASRESKRFASGRGAATGVLVHEDSSKRGRGIVIVL